MRVSILRLLVILVAASTAGEARAEDWDRVKWPKRTKALYLGGGATYLGNEGLGGPSVTGEYALGCCRWQLLGDAGLTWYIPDGDGGGGGLGARAGVAGRWLARSFRADSSARIEMFMNGGTGIEHLAVGDGHVTRPDLWVGWGVQVRLLEKKRMMRITFRVAVAPSLDDDMVDRLACRGTCTSVPSTSPLDDSFQTMLGWAW